MQIKELKIVKTSSPKSLPDFNHLGFGKIFTDHMFVMDYQEDRGWYDPRIIPYGEFQIDPAAMVLHYGQAVFEGMKAYKHNGRVTLFRPRKNFERMNLSNERLCIPEVDADFMVEALKELIKLDERWIPSPENTSLYIRPFVIAMDPILGVKPASTYKFMIICSPVGAYYPEGLNPVKIYVEPKYVRSVRGGVGFAKTIGNYAASLKAQAESKEKGYTQVLWLDAIDRKFVEEVGTMNVFFALENEIVTPPLEGSILPGITRESVISLLRHWGHHVVERKISIDELFSAHQSGALKEIFGTGTAACISPVGELFYDDKKMIINHSQTGPLSAKLYDTLTSIQYGKQEDPFGWVMQVL